jgi:acid stress chaperone HdeA
MRKLLLLSTVLGIGVAASVMPAEAKKTNLTKMTCEEFLGLSEDVQPRAVAWLDGYSKSGKLKEEDVGEVDVDRQMAVLVVACKEDPKKTLWDKISAHLPAGMHKAKPTKMTCQEYVDMQQTDRPELVYWADGYNRRAKVKEGAVDEVDLERDVAVIYEDCQQAPKESLWAKLKKHL